MARKNEIDYSAPIFDHLRHDVPNKKQAKFFSSKAKYVAYGGARGGGKSWAMRRKAVMLCMRYEKLRILLLRRTYRELSENHVRPLVAELAGYARFNQQEMSFNFPNGSRLVLGYCDNDADCMRYQGQEYEVIMFDEATNFLENWIRFISSTLRTTRTDFRTRIYFTCNPGGPGHAYIKRLFIDRNYKDKEDPDDYEFIAARVYDNKALMDASPDYVKNLEALPSNIRKAHLEGDWNVYSGQVFDEFRDDPEHYIDRKWTHVIETFTPPANWKIYRAFDHGYSKPFAMTYFAVDEDGRLYELLEIYGCVAGEENVGVKFDVNKIAETVCDVEKSHPYLSGKEIRGIADPAIWQRTTGVSIAETLAEHGLYFDKGENARIPSIQQVHNRLCFDENGIPMIYFFKNCKDMIRTLPTLQYDDNKVEDVDTDGEDHLFDTLRYMCAANPIRSLPNVKERLKMYDPLEADDTMSGVGTYKMMYL